MSAAKIEGHRQVERKVGDPIRVFVGGNWYTGTVAVVDRQKGKPTRVHADIDLGKRRVRYEMGWFGSVVKEMASVEKRDLRRVVSSENTYVSNVVNAAKALARAVRSDAGDSVVDQRVVSLLQATNTLEEMEARDRKEGK